MRSVLANVVLVLVTAADPECSAQHLDRTEMWQARLLTLIQQSDPAPPGASNGWCDLLECGETIKRVEYDLYSANFDDGLNALASDWPYREPEPGSPPLGSPDRVRAQLCGLLDGHGVTAAIRRAEAAQRWSPVPAVSESHQVAGLGADLSFFYPIARIARGRITYSASRGEWNVAAEWIGFGLMSAYASERGAGLISGAMGVAGRSIICAGLREFNHRNPPPASVLKVMLESFDRYEAMPPFEQFMRLDEVEIQHAIDSMYSSEGVVQVARVVDALYMVKGFAQMIKDWNEELSEEELSIRWSDLVRQGLTSDWINMFGFLAPRRDQTERYVGEFVNVAIAGLASATPAVSVKESLDKFLDDHADRYAAANAFLRAYPDAWARFIRQHAEATAIQNGTRLLLALELYRAETGSLPDSLDALVPHILPQPLTDPFAPDGRFRYKRIPVDRAADPRGIEFLLYSVGLDGIDNSGTLPPSGRMHDANKPDGNGSDYVFKWANAID